MIVGTFVLMTGVYIILKADKLKIPIVKLHKYQLAKVFWTLSILVVKIKVKLYIG